MRDVNTVYQTLMAYLGYNPVVLVLFLISLYVVVNEEKEHRKRYVLVCFFSLLFIFNDVVRRILGLFTGISTYYRFFWAVPFLFLGVKAAMDVVGRTSGRAWRFLTVLLLALCVYLGRVGTVPLSRDMVPDNIYNLSNDVIAVSDMIKKDKSVEQPRVVADFQMQMELRCYDATLIWGIGRTPYELATKGDWYAEGRYEKDMSIVRMVCNGFQEDADYVRNALEKRKVDYVVTYSDFGLNAYLEEIGYAVIGKSATRTIYGKQQ